jgi:F0F1-type ATP synthase membrane subunit b/b'
MLATASTLALALAGGGWLSEAARAVNIGIFLLILFLLLRKPIGRLFDSRLQQIKTDLERAQREKGEAEAKLAEVEARLARIDAEKERIFAESEVEAEAEHARISARTEEETRKIAETAEREIGAALKIARADLQRFVAEQAVTLAESTIKAELNEEDRKRMLDQYAAQLEGVRK